MNADDIYHRRQVITLLDKIAFRLGVLQFTLSTLLGGMFAGWMQ